jgi:hypothetical protein
MSVTLLQVGRRAQLGEGMERGRQVAGQLWFKRLVAFSLSSFVWPVDKRLPSAFFVLQALDLDESEATPDAHDASGGVKTWVTGREVVCRARY